MEILRERFARGEIDKDEFESQETELIVVDDTYASASENGRCPVEDSDLKHRFHLMQTEIEATASLLKDAKIDLTSAPSTRSKSRWRC